MNHDAAFAEHRALRAAQRAATPKVTWRKVSDLTGGGWSGLGPDGTLVWIALHGDGSDRRLWDFGRVVDGARVREASVMGNSAVAKAAAERLLRRVPAWVETPGGVAGALNRYDRIYNDAPIGAEGGNTMSPTATAKAIPTAESLIEGMDGFDCLTPGKAPYCRIRFTGVTLAYASPRRDGVLLDFATKAVEEAPARFKKSLEEHGIRTTFKVTTRNIKGARELLNWIAPRLAAPAASL